MKAEAKKKAQASRQVSVSDFRLQQGFFYNADQSPATLLDSLLPDSSGVHLCSCAEARGHLDAFRQQACDELALVVLGLQCPEPDSCQEALTFPAVNQASEPVLLRGCLHQLGEQKISFRCTQDIRMELNDLVCCAFTVRREDWKEDEWQPFLQSPARRILEIFAAGGVEKAFESPCGRSYRAGSAPTTPAACDSIQFHGRVLRSLLDEVLKRSGHNKFLLPPKPGLMRYCRATRSSGWARTVNLQHRPLSAFRLSLAWFWPRTDLGSEWHVLGLSRHISSSGRMTHCPCSWMSS